MINTLYRWAKHNQSLYIGDGLHERFADLLLNTVFFYRYKLERSTARVKALEHSKRAYRRKLDQLYRICNEYAAYGESCTQEGTAPEEESVLYRD